MIPTTNQQALNTVESALEHASHAWNYLRKAGMVPPDTDDTGWPPIVPHRHMGTAAYHWAAVIDRLKLMLRRIAVNTFKTYLERRP
jgi:hypothetical protein